MKKMLFLTVVAGLMLASCGNNPKSDAEKICNCRKKVLQKVVDLKGNRSYEDMSKEDQDKIEVLVKECDAKEEKLKEKYKDEKLTEFKDALDACYDKVQKEFEGKIE